MRFDRRYMTLSPRERPDRDPGCYRSLEAVYTGAVNLFFALCSRVVTSPAAHATRLVGICSKLTATTMVDGCLVLAHDWAAVLAHA